MLDKQLTQKIIITITLLLSLLASHLYWLDSFAEEYTEQGIKRTLITYAVSRSLNGVISVAQGTQVAVSPAGVGFTFAPGQILDPVNDLIERFSWVVMVSGSSLGIQRLFLSISSSQLIIWSLTLISLIYLILLWLNKSKLNMGWQSRLTKTVIIIVFIRFSVPIVAVINEALYVGFLQSQYESSQTQLENTSSNIEIINQESKEKVKQSTQDGVFNKVEQWFDQTKKSLDVKTQMSSLKQAAADVSEQVINMIVVFVVQTIIFPLLFLWLLIRASKGILKSVSI